MGRMVQRSITNNVKYNGQFSILADKTKECRNMEHMSVVVGYFHNGSHYESFVSFVQVTDLTSVRIVVALIYLANARIMARLYD